MWIGDVREFSWVWVGCSKIPMKGFGRKRSLGVHIKVEDAQSIVGLKVR